MINEIVVNGYLKASGKPMNQMNKNTPIYPIPITTLAANFGWRDIKNMPLQKELPESRRIYVCG